MLSCIIAAEAFVGEKERKTLEALLYTPATDGELFLGKALAALIPGIVYTWVNFAIFAVVTNTRRLSGHGQDLVPDGQLVGTDDLCRAGRGAARCFSNRHHLHHG